MDVVCIIYSIDMHDWRSPLFPQRKGWFSHHFLYKKDRFPLHLFDRHDVYFPRIITF